MSSITDLLNALEDDEARAALLRCCGSRAWVDAVMSHRPFTDDDHVFAVAAEAWSAVGPEDWLEAFAAHPRIGDRVSASWSREEQAGMDGADEVLQAAIRDGNVAYEARFGHVFLICATGKTAQDMHRALMSRLANDPESELRIAAAEQAEITRLRLKKLVASEESS